VIREVRSAILAPQSKPQGYGGFERRLFCEVLPTCEKECVDPTQQESTLVVPPDLYDHSSSSAYRQCDTTCPIQSLDEA
jgi:hypothetical protein